MAFVKGKLRQKYRITRQLIVIVQKCTFRGVINHEEHIQVIAFVSEDDRIRIGCSEIVFSLLERICHESIAVGCPVERSRRRHSAIGPTILVDDVDDLSLVRKSSVLHASAIEIFRRIRFQGKRIISVFAKLYRRCLLKTMVGHGMFSLE